MKNKLAVLVVSAALCVSVLGCGGEQQASSGKKAKRGPAGGPPDVTTAAQLAQDQDAEPLEAMQMNCIVCGERPLKGDIHADISMGNRRGRLYFDKQECLDKFQEDKQKYLQRMGQ